MFLAPWLFLIDDEIKANVATSLLEQLLILIAQGQTQILPNTWNLLKILKKKKERKFTSHAKCGEASRQFRGSLVVRVPERVQRFHTASSYSSLPLSYNMERSYFISFQLLIVLKFLIFLSFC